METQIEKNTYFEKNMELCRLYHPQLYEQIKNYNDTGSFKIEKFNEDDYAVFRNTGRQWSPWDKLNVYNKETAITDMNDLYNDIKNKTCIGVIFYGLDAGMRLIYFFSLIRETIQPVYVIERRVEIFKLIISQLDLSDILKSERVFFFLGDKAAQEAVDFLKHNRMLFLPFSGRITANAADVEFYRNAVSVISGYVKDFFINADRHMHAVNNHFASQTKNDLIALFKPQDNRKLNILTELNTTTRIMQHVTRNCAESFKRLGHKVLLLEETKVRAIRHHYHFFTVLGEFMPQFWLIINHTSKEQMQLSDNFAAVTWVLDPAPYLFNARIPAGEKIGKYDQVLVIARHFMKDDLQKLGFPEAQLHHFYFGGDTYKYYPRVLLSDEQKQFGADISYVGNYHSDSEPQAVLSIEIAQLLFSRMIQEEKFYPEEIKLMLKDIDEKHGRIRMDQRVEQSYRNTLGRHYDDEYVRMVYGWLALSGVALRNSYLESIRDMNLSVFGYGWEKYNNLNGKTRGPVAYGEAIGKIFQASKINLHFASFSNNHPRIFDIIASGGFLLTHFTPEDLEPGGIGDLFEIGKEIEVFHTKKEMREKIEYYLAHDDLRQEIAARGRERLLREHTMEHRMQQMLDIVYKGLIESEN